MEYIPTLVTFYAYDINIDVYNRLWLNRYNGLVPGLGETNGYTLGISIYVGFLTNK